MKKRYSSAGARVPVATSFQDNAHTSVVVEALRHAAAGGAGVLVATHDSVVIAAADRVLEVVAK